MFETYNNSLCVHASWMIESNFVSKPSYDKLQRSFKLRVLRRGCKGTPALVEYISIPANIRQKIMDVTGGNPLEFHQKNAFENKLMQNDKAHSFFYNYTTSNGKALPSKRIQEYIANAIVLEALGKEYDAYMAKRNALVSKDASFWKKMIELIAGLHTYPHALPMHPRRLQAKLEEYKNKGFESLIHAGFDNSNSEKINEEAKMFVVAQWAKTTPYKIASMAQLLVEYNAQAIRKGWKTLKDEATLHLFLNKPNIKPLWFAARYGEGKAKEKFIYQHSTKMPSMRDSLWYSDGTKMNYYYLENGKMQTCQVYEVMDAYSEVFLGYHVSETENFEAQYFAYKMAAEFAGHRPYEINMDNQGGHKKLESMNFMSDLARLSMRTQPYNGKSKTIELAFKRFQEHYLEQDWFCTGMNIQAKQLASKANMENIMANKNDLPSLQEAKAAYVKRRTEWNNAKHPKMDCTRMEAYLASTNPESAKLERWDMVNLFWLQRENTVKATAYGITFTENKIKHTYMVNDADGYPDLEWLCNNIDKSFAIKFDPQDKSTIYLYENTALGLRFCTEATTKVQVQRNKQEQQQDDTQFLAKLDAKIKDKRIAMQNLSNQILEDHNLRAEQHGFVTPHIRGLQSSKKVKRKDNAREVVEVDYDKAISNADDYTENQSNSIFTQIFKK
jgi:hypothetical protein